MAVYESYLRFSVRNGRPAVTSRARSTCISFGLFWLSMFARVSNDTIRETEKLIPTELIPSSRYHRTASGQFHPSNAIQLHKRMPSEPLKRTHDQPDGIRQRYHTRRMQVKISQLRSTTETASNGKPTEKARCQPQILCYKFSSKLVN